MARTVELIFKGNNRSVIRALDDIATKSQRTGKQVQKDSKTSSSGFEQMGRSATKLRGVVGGLAGTVGLGGLAFGIKDVVSAGENWQKQQAQLQGALRNTGQFSKSTLSQLNSAASSMAGQGGFGTAENLQSLTQFVSATGSATKAQRDLGLATDISRRTGKDYTTVVRALMMLENGRTTGLARLGLAVPKVTTAQNALNSRVLAGKDKLLALEAAGVKLTTSQKAQLSLSNQISPAVRAQARAQDALASKQQAFVNLQRIYSGATSQFSRTTAGQVSNLRNRFKELQERVGAGLLPVVNKLVGALSATVGWLNKHRAVLYGVLAAVGLLTTAMAFNSVATTLATTKTILFGTTATEMGAGAAATAGEVGLLSIAMDAMPIFAVITGLVLLVTHFGLVKKAAAAAWNWIKIAAADTWNWIKGHWPLLAGILLAPFTGGISIIVGLFHKQIIGAINDVWRFVERAATAIFNALTWPFRKAAQVAKSVWHGITGAAGGALHTLSFGLLHSGGVVKPRYFASGGPVGMDTIPGWLTPGEGVVNTRGMGVIGAGGLASLNQGVLPGAAGGGFEVTYAQPIQFRVDSRVLAEAVAGAVLRRAARGPSALSGGSLLAGPGHAT